MVDIDAELVTSAAFIWRRHQGRPIAISRWQCLRFSPDPIIEAIYDADRFLVREIIERYEQPSEAAVALFRINELLNLGVLKAADGGTRHCSRPSTGTVLCARVDQLREHPATSKVMMHEQGLISASIALQGSHTLDGLAPAVRVFLVGDIFESPSSALLNEAHKCAGDWLVAELGHAEYILSPVFAGKTGVRSFRVFLEKLKKNHPIEVNSPAGQDLMYALKGQCEKQLCDSFSADHFIAKVCALTQADNAKYVICLAASEVTGHFVCGRNVTLFDDGSPLHAWERPDFKRTKASPQLSRQEVLELGLVDQYCGDVRSVSRLDVDEKSPVKNFFADHYFPDKASSDNVFRSSKYNSSAGKGFSEGAAFTGAVCEAMERMAAIWEDGRRVTRTSYNTLRRSENVLHPDSLTQYSERQFQSRDEINKLGSHFTSVCKPFDPDATIDWVQCYSLCDGSPAFVPSGFCFYGHPESGYDGYFVPDSNGNALAGSWDEAIHRGLLEVIERDRVAIWWYNELLCPRIDLSALENPEVDALTAYLTSLGREFWALDISLDLGIPCVVALSVAAGAGGRNDLIFGFGCDIEFEKALMKAAAELGQFLPTITPEPDGKVLYRYARSEVLSWFSETAGRIPSFMVGREAPNRQYDVSTFERTIEHVLARTELSSDAFYLPIGISRSKLYTAKVIVPGYRHFWRRLAPGRLYEIPVERGLLARPKRESDLNRYTVFF